MTAATTKELVSIFIDQQEFELEPGVCTASQLLELAGENPAETILVLRIGDDLDQLSSDKGFEPKPGSRFVVFHCGPTPVS